jgi:hypothetical protein
MLENAQGHRASISEVDGLALGPGRPRQVGSVSELHSSINAALRVSPAEPLPSLWAKTKKPHTAPPLGSLHPALASFQSLFSPSLSSSNLHSKSCSTCRKLRPSLTAGPPTLTAPWSGIASPITLRAPPAVARPQNVEIRRVACGDPHRRTSPRRRRRCPRFRPPSSHRPPLRRRPPLNLFTWRDPR